MEPLRPRLLAVSEELVESELASLKFLSLEYFPMRKLEAIQNAQDFFEALRERGMIEAGNLFFLKELLYRISRIDLLAAHLGSSREEMERELKIPGRAQVSAYRYLLFQLSEDVTKDELDYFKLLLENELPKCRQNPETITMMLDIFIAMEKKGILGEDNLSRLKSLCAEVNISLLKRIEEYELNLFGKSNSTGSYKYSQQLEAYKMTSRPRGVCLILNNHNFAKAREAVPELRNLRDRDGTDMDAAALRRVFSKLHFAVVEHRDLTAEGMRKTVDIYRCEDHKDKDCFVCCILSHGKKGSVYGVDGQEVPIQELTTSFTGHNCYSLAGKPKVFFIQACQGESFQKGVPIETDSLEQDSSAETDARLQFDCIPSEADFLLGMATLQDYVSYRNRREGTWYIQALCQHLEYSCPRGEDILTILTAVNQEVSKKSCSQNVQKQMPQPSFTLRKRLIFPVN
ncbi:caspase-8-like isoform X1 [Melanerpes formicivorus]|uniref:caspase-8-like isoform X1 n=1 Tax=Melanerpes formicivorus TaxID=211600 RepID=UPI00358F5AD3